MSERPYHGATSRSRRCTKSSTMFGGLIHQGGNTKYEGVSNMSEKSMLKAVKKKPQLIAYDIRPGVKQLHIFVIKHCDMCGMFRH